MALTPQAAKQLGLITSTPDDLDWTDEIRIDRLDESLGGCLLDNCDAEYSGVVHQNVGSAVQLAGDAPGRLLDASGIADIARDGYRPLDARRVLLELHFTPRYQSHPHALAAERLGDRGANSSGSAGYDSGLPAE